MSIIQEAVFGGSPDDLVWKHPCEEFAYGSRVIVDETHQVLVCINGQATDLWEAGAHALDVPSLPIANGLFKLATGGDNPFICKLFYISKIHQSNLLWGTQGGPVVVEDPLYRIFLHVMTHGSLYYVVTDPRKLVLKLAGFQARFGREEVTSQFRGIISSHVKDAVSKIMINGKLSFFMIAANQMELSAVVKESLELIFAEYGIGINYFNIETVEVPDEDYSLVAEAKQRAASRLAEGYSWQEEREMMVREQLAANPAAAAAALAMGTSFGEIARQAVFSSAPPQPAYAPQQPAYPQPQQPVYAAPPQPVYAAPPQQPQPAGVTCPACGAQLEEGSRFCNKCGQRIESAPVCSGCGQKLAPGSAFCNFCGTKVGT